MTENQLCESIDEEPLLQNQQFHTNYRSYTRRWWVLLIFSASCIAQSLIWNTFAPIKSTVMNETSVNLDIHSSDIYLFTNWGPIGFILFMPLFTYLMSTSNLKICINFTSILLILAGLLRIIPSTVFPDIKRKWLFHLAQFFNGIAGCLPVSAPAHLSALWFSEEQRGFSTSIIFSS